jgi:hypothetical protein
MRKHGRVGNRLVEGDPDQRSRRPGDTAECSVRSTKFDLNSVPLPDGEIDLGLHALRGDIVQQAQFLATGGEPELGDLVDDDVTGATPTFPAGSVWIRLYARKKHYESTSWQEWWITMTDEFVSFAAPIWLALH